MESLRDHLFAHATFASDVRGYRRTVPTARPAQTHLGTAAPSPSLGLPPRRAAQAARCHETAQTASLPSAPPAALPRVRLPTVHVHPQRFRWDSQDRSQKNACRHREIPRMPPRHPLVWFHAMRTTSKLHRSAVREWPAHTAYWRETAAPPQDSVRRPVAHHSGVLRPPSKSGMVRHRAIIREERWHM